MLGPRAALGQAYPVGKPVCVVYCCLIGMTGTFSEDLQSLASLSDDPESLAAESDSGDWPGQDRTGLSSPESVQRAAGASSGGEGLAQGTGGRLPVQEQSVQSVECTGRQPGTAGLCRTPSGRAARAPAGVSTVSSFR